MTLYTPDYIGLFAAIAGAVATTGANIVDARVFTTSDGMAIDTIWIQAAGGGAFRDEERLERLKQSVVRALSEDDAGAGRADEAAFVAAPRPERSAPIALEPHVLVDNGASRGYTVIEVSARDRPGLLYDITRTLSACGVSIGSAHISTVGSRAVDVFYVEGPLRPEALPRCPGRAGAGPPDRDARARGRRRARQARGRSRAAPPRGRLSRRPPRKPWHSPAGLRLSAATPWARACSVSCATF